MGTPEFAVPSLSALMQSGGHEILLVVTQPDKPQGRGMHLQSPPVKATAVQSGLEVLQPASLKGAAALKDMLISSRLDAVIVVAYGKMIPDEMLAIPAHGFINVHASLLPVFRGAAPINRAILAGCATTGVSIMQIDSGMDSGPVFLQSEVPIPEDEDAVGLSARLSELGAEKLLETLDLLERGMIEAKPQEHDKATYAPMLKKEEGEIDWSLDPRSIHNMVRGLLPWPCAYTFFDSKMLKILKSTYRFEEHALEFGTLSKTDHELTIACKEGFLLPQVLQLEGKKALDARAFSNGLHASRVMLGNAART